MPHKSTMTKLIIKIIINQIAELMYEDQKQ